MADKFLKIIIPYEQEGPHKVGVAADFDDSWGVQVHTVNPYDVEVDRVRDLTLLGGHFNFESLNLNKTGYEFLIKFKGDDTAFRIKEATEVTKFEVVNE